MWSRSCSKKRRGWYPELLPPEDELSVGLRSSALFVRVRPDESPPGRATCIPAKRLVGQAGWDGKAKYLPDGRQEPTLYSAIKRVEILIKPYSSQIENQQISFYESLPLHSENISPFASSNFAIFSICSIKNWINIYRNCYWQYRNALLYYGLGY